jgi:hypothetical protein
MSVQRVCIARVTTCIAVHRRGGYHTPPIWGRDTHDAPRVTRFLLGARYLPPPPRVTRTGAGRTAAALAHIVGQYPAAAPAPPGSVIPTGPGGAENSQDPKGSTAAAAHLC